ncbi:subunit 17 of mediator complex-domain-containing protein [Trichophaea hybrida]|nr:subunit 17 of mediator complex-domain-containing protein [Trichophaea hybrida]
MDSPLDDALNLSLRTWLDHDPQDSAVSTFISRIQSQRGHFKDINEALLESEIASPNDAAAPPEDPIEEDSTPAAEDESNPTEKLAKAKAEMIDLLGHAHNEALLALDFISLAVSLNAPDVGMSTMSPALKAAVPPGCLGFDRISRKVDKAAQEDDKKVARAWKMEGLNSAADALLGASKKLGAEVEKETKYWEGVLAIRNDGWLITRMPKERNVLGVRYGFAEAAREYKDKGIGALRRNDDGTVRMDDVDTTGVRGRAMLRVRIVKNGEVVGMSTQRAGKNDGSVRDMIRRARNFIYEDELFFEIMKEARIFAGQGVRTSEDAAMIELGEGKMAPLDDDTVSPPPSNPFNTLAQSISLALRILLSYNHRLSLQRRSKPPLPLSNRKTTLPSLQLLRPITTHLLHQQHLNHLTAILQKVRLFSTTAGLTASYTIRPMSNTLSKTIKDVESAVETFIHLLETEAIVKLPGGWTLGITMRTVLQRPVHGTQYVVTTSHDGVSIRLMGENRFSSQDEMENYLWWCLERSVVNWIRLTTEWKQEAQGNEMIGSKGRIRVEVVGAVGLAVTWGATGARDEKFVWDGTEKGKTLAELLVQIGG